MTHSWKDVLSVLTNHKAKSVMFFFIVLGLCATYILFAPRKYRSTARYLVRVGHESVALDPTASVGETMGLYRTSDSLVKSVTEILKSDDVAYKVVDQLGANTVLERDPSKSPSLIARLKNAVSSLDPISDKEKAQITLKENLQIQSPNQSNVVIVSYDAPSPELALQIMQSVSTAFVSEHSRINQTEGSFEFFEKQHAVLTEELEQKSKRLRDTKNQHEISSIDGRRANLEGQLSQVQSSQLSVERSLASNTVKIRELNSMTISTPDKVDLEATSGVNNDATSKMRQTLYDLELREAGLLSRFDKTHPHVVAVQELLTEARKIFAEMQTSHTETSRGLNPLHQQLSLQLLSENAIAKSLIAEKQILAEQNAELKSQLAALNQQEMEIFHLSTAVDIAKTKFETHSVLLEQARLDHALSKENISSIGIIQRPRLSERPSKPSKKLVAVLGILLATAGAFGLPFAIEYLNAADSSLSPIDRGSSTDDPYAYTNVVTPPRRHSADQINDPSKNRNSDGDQLDHSPRESAEP